MNPATGNRRRECAAWACALLVINAPMLVTGEVATGLAFRPDAVAVGEWWRVLLHPLVHVSAYHFLLDAGAFLLLIRQLEAKSPLTRTLLAAVCATGSLLASILFAPAVYERGLCGLSGAAHGLMAVTGLELAARSNRLDGWLCLALLIGKVVIEAATGTVFFSEWHLGPIGAPIAACHAGGVAAGLLSGLILLARRQGTAGPRDSRFGNLLAGFRVRGENVAQAETAPD
jgi:rhomboid family GlyGly-CTERM serine protease